MQDIPHIPVLYREVIDIVKDINNGIIVDCTLGYGGHSSMMLESCADAKLIGIDQDITAIEFSKKRGGWNIVEVFEFANGKMLRATPKSKSDAYSFIDYYLSEGFRREQ